MYPISQPEDFVKQAYANLNSDCLFEMSAKDLQAAWKIPVLTWQNFEELKNLETAYREQLDVPYYVLMNKDTIRLEASDDFLVKNGSLLIKKIDGLPEPNKVISASLWDSGNHWGLERQKGLIKKNGGIMPFGGYFKNISQKSDFLRNSKFYWLNINPEKPSIYIHTDENSSVAFIDLYHRCNIHCYYFK